MTKKVLECLWEMKYVNLGLKRPPTFPLEIMDFIVVLIKVVIMVEVDIDIKRPANLTLIIVEQGLMLMGEVDIVMTPDNITTITQVPVVASWVYHFLLVQCTKMFMVVIELDIGLKPATINPITQVGAVLNSQFVFAVINIRS